MKNESDFSKGSIKRNIMRLAIPMTLAQLINILYNIVDRIFLGHLGNGNSLELTGVGVCLPVISMMAAFPQLIASGGPPLFSIERGKGNDDEAEKILSNSFIIVLVISVLVALFVFLTKEPLLYALGASKETFPYANAYLSVYLIGTVFSLVTLGLNGFINSQGFATTAMITVALGAALNIILDPILIFSLNLGVKGAALATVISQGASMIWNLKFLFGKKAVVRIMARSFKLESRRVKRILGLGVSGFAVMVTNASVQIVNNVMLQGYGGDTYVGIMTIANSIREVVTMPVSGIGSGTQPVMGYNFGAKRYDRVRESIRFMIAVGIIYTMTAWLVIVLIPGPIMSVFTSDKQILSLGVKAMHIYFFGFVFMAFQFIGQTAFQALGLSKRAVFFSVFRKIIIVVPLAIILPRLFGLGVSGVFLAEPISNLVGGGACFLTMYFTVYRKLGKDTIVT